jgi:hypothetical protein
MTFATKDAQLEHVPLATHVSWGSVEFVCLSLDVIQRAQHLVTPTALMYHHLWVIRPPVSTLVVDLIVQQACFLVGLVVSMDPVLR